MSPLRSRYDTEGSRELRGATRRGLEPSLATDEQVILRSRGGYKDNGRPIWKLGTFYLTNQRLLLFVPTGIRFETPLANIRAVSVEDQRYIAGGIKDAIAIGYQNPASQRPSKAWLVMADLETWRQRLYERTLLEVDPETLNRVLEQLDPQSRGIVEYIWQNKHARIDELSELIEAPAHMDVLLKIKGVINPTAERITGHPLLVFERARVDPETGEKVLFSWWVIAPARLAEKGRGEALVDVFNEGDHIDLVAELPGVKEEDIVLCIVRDRVVISAPGREGGYHEEIVLPSPVDPDKFLRSYRNNILALTLQKLHP